MEGEVPVTATPAGVIDSRIDVHAQYALLRMAKGDPSAQADASAMLAAVKSGRLAGIYKEDQQVPALRAKRQGIGWWQLIPAGRDAVVVNEAGAAPIIVFRDRVRSDASRLDPALRAAWRSLQPPAGGGDMVYHPRMGWGRRVPGRGTAHAELEWGGGYRDELEEEIIGTDGRVRVNPTTGVPFRWVCHLRLLFPDPATPGGSLVFVGSGTLIGNRHVLTAAHNLRDRLPGGGAGLFTATAVTATPGRNLAATPFGSSASTTLRVAPGWNGSTPAADFGLITLADDLGSRRHASLGNQPLGFWSSPDRGAGTRLRPLADNVVRGAEVNVSGYPGDKCGATPATGSATAAQLGACGAGLQGSAQFRAFGRVTEPSPVGAALLAYNMDTAGGHSGSPVWLRWEQQRNLVAVHSGGLNPAPITSNVGVRITDAVLAQLRTWMRADGVTPAF
jgi:V8-like Glu-specific endopeptidase